MYKIKEYLLRNENSCYAKHYDRQEYRFDCGLGQNPFGMSGSARRAWPLLSPEVLSHYPESRELVGDILAWLSPLGELRPEHVSLGCGSIGLLCRASRMFTGEHGTVLGYVPQFTAFIDDVENQGACFAAYRLGREQNFRFSLPDFLSLAEESDHDLIYIDNPNNPTGQVLPLQDIEEIVAWGERHDTAVFIDEAFGDYLPEERSAVNLVPRFRNLLVFRTFSKGFGLAGLRGAYLVSDPEIIRCCEKIGSPYEFNGPARVIASAALKERDFLETCRKTVFQCKEQLLASLKRFRIAATDPHIPISLLYVEDMNTDLQGYLHRYQIHTISGTSFPGLGKNFVRMNLHPEFEELLEVLIQADRDWRPADV